MIYKIKQLWYRFKCWSWHRYTTIKPRSLSHEWCDKVDLLPHTMFELLSQFIENECSPGDVDWYDPEWGHKVKVNDVERFTMDEMKALYNWWNKKYLKAYPEIIDSLYDLISDEPMALTKSDRGFSTVQFRDRDTKIYNTINRIEERIDEELEEKMIRLVKIRRSLWT